MSLRSRWRALRERERDCTDDVARALRSAAEEDDVTRARRRSGGAAEQDGAGPTGQQDR